jgi:hypothetical protein
LIGLTEGRSYLLLTLALIVFALAPLTYPGTMQVHSGFVPAYNLADLTGRPLSLRWTPTVATNFDPLRGDGLLAYYLALPVVWLGATPVQAVKVVFALGWVLGAVGVYLWLRRSLGAPGACLAALVYTYLPYHIAAVIVRGAWGESLCLGLIPLGMLAALAQDDARATLRRLLLASLAWLFIGLSQPGLAVWAWLCLAGWWLLGGSPRRRGMPVLAAWVGVAMAVAFTLWAAGWQIANSPITFYDHFLLPSQLFSARWGFGASRPGWDDGLALGFGFAAVGLTTLTLLLALQRVRLQSLTMGSIQSPTTGFRLRVPLILALALSFFLFSPSASLWQTLGLHHLLTYPWQLLGLIGLCLSVLAGASLKLDRQLSTLPMQAALIAITLLASYGYLQPRFTHYSPGSAPLASWNGYHVMLMDLRMEAAMPPAAAGLAQPTPGRLPLSDYGALKPGDTLRLLLTWQAMRPFDRDLKLFVHLLDRSEQIVAQADPLAGAGADPDSPKADYPTSRWEPGRLITTDVPITLPPDAPGGPYHVAFGLYDGETLERLPVDGNGEGRITAEVTGKELSR